MVLTTMLFAFGCKNDTRTLESEQSMFENEKEAILETINEETKAAFNRNYLSWREKWVHDSFVTKTYMNMTDSSMSETIGWEEINLFVKNYIEEHPERDPVPSLVDDIKVQFYGNGAWVNFDQNDSLRGLKRETRLMHKVNGKWKIAGMHTTIYGFRK